MKSILAAFMLSCLLCTAALPGARGADQNQPIEGVGPAGKIVAVHTGFEFTEGPAADAHGNLYFSDIRPEKVYRIGLDGQLSVFLEDSRRTNGLMFDGAGRLVACEGGDNNAEGVARIVAYDVPPREPHVVAGQHQGKPFNRVNDLVLDRAGGVYFTDIMGESGMAQETPGVYYAAPDGSVTRLIDNLVRPNGVILSPDESRLYVLPAGTPAVMQYVVESPGQLGAGSELCVLPYPADAQPRGGDGLTVDSQGRLYVTVPAMSLIQVVTPMGQVLGRIAFPEAPANCTFGGADMKTLFVTARTSVYAVPMQATGHRFTGTVTVRD